LNGLKTLNKPFGQCAQPKDGRGLRLTHDHLRIGCNENQGGRILGRHSRRLPSPFDLNQHMTIDGITGTMEHAQVCPPEGNSEMNLLVALGAGPDLAVGGKPSKG
jgi:hypothetical protein